MHVTALVSMVLQTSQAWVPSLQRNKTNWAQGQIYSWVEQQALSGLSPNTTTAGRNQIPCEAAVEIIYTKVHNKNYIYPSHYNKDILGWVGLSYHNITFAYLQY